MRAFISYSHADKPYCDQLNKHLAVLKCEKLLDAWYDQEILPGGDIDHEISKQLESCQLFLPLVSSDFLDSSYCHDKEMGQAIAQCQSGQTIIIPIALRSCDWKESAIGQFKGLPYDGKGCIAVSKWKDKDDAFFNIVQGLRQVLTTNRAKEEKDASTSAQPPVVPSETISRPRYRVRRDFNKIDVGEFREQAFQEILSYFESSVQGINDTDGIRARLFSSSGSSFSCIIVNSGLGSQGTANISLHAGGGQFGGFGDIWYSFSENTPNSANGSLSIESDGFNLFLKPIFSMWQAAGGSDLISPETAAEMIWCELIEQAGVTVD